jgi:uncharacterized alpha/beta hydrolase family protein
MKNIHASIIELTIA